MKQKIERKKPEIEWSKLEMQSMEQEMEGMEQKHLGDVSIASQKECVCTVFSYARTS